MKLTEAIQLSWGPLAMTEENYRKVVAGLKTQTRRVAPVKPGEFPEEAAGLYPKYQPGEIYYLPEPVQIMGFWQYAGSCTMKYLWTGTFSKRWLTNDDTDSIIARKRGWNAPTTARFMLKSFAREFVRIKSVKVERLQDITPEDIWAEGIHYDCTKHGSILYTWIELWNSIHGSDAWDANPWVWVYEFERLEVSE